MKVKAIELGYYDHKRRRPGAVFELKPVKALIMDPKSKFEKPLLDKDGKKQYETVSVEKQFSKTWMEKVNANVPLTPEKKAKAQVPTGSPNLSEESDEEVAESDVI